MRRLALGLLWCLLAASSARAQTDPLRVASVRLSGDLDPFDDEEVRALLRTQPNREFLGLPGVTPGLWIHQLGAAGTLGGALSGAFLRSGEPPADLDLDLVEADRTRLELLYRQAGYRSALVAARVDTLSAERADVRFEIDRGPPSLIASVRYEGLDGLGADAQGRLARTTRLRLVGVRNADTLAFAARGQRLSEPDLLDERRRLLAFLRDEGFAGITRDSVRAVAFAVDSLRFDVAFRVSTGPRYDFGDVWFEVRGPETDPARADTLRVGDGTVVSAYSGEGVLETRLLARSLQFQPGASYSRSDLLATKRRLERTGVFSFTEVAPVAAGGVSTDTVPRLGHRIELRTRRRHSLRFEGFVLQRTPILPSDDAGISDSELGIGIGSSYRNANLFGGAEAFAVRLSGSVAGAIDIDEALGSWQAEAATSLTYPYLIFPFGFAERALRPFDARTRLSLGFLTARQQELGILIRGRASAGLRFTVQHSPSLTSLLDLVDLRLSDPDTFGDFEDNFLDSIEDPVVRAAILNDYTEPQINNALRYTLRATTADLFRRDQGYARDAALEVGGNLSYLLDRFVFTPDTLEGALPGLPVLGGGNELTYRPYARAIGDVREYRPVGRLSTVAAKAIVGFAHPTGTPDTVPFDRRFYAGGASSVRGWRLGRLGPGNVSSGDAFAQGGEVKLEVGMEFRTLLLRQLFAADWSLALFSDAGNVWLGPRNPSSAGRFRFDSFAREIAVGAGVGLRVAYEFLIVRFDLAWQVRSPNPDDPLFPAGNEPQFYFGIGQAF
ncbi:MAG: BamA/TamA family outer membrane protein [Bacteroidota bacterium]